jgi:hypothetical protein
MLLRRVLCRLGAQRTLVAFRTLVCMIADCVECKDAAAQKSLLQATPDPTGGRLLGVMSQAQLAGTASSSSIATRALN